MADGGSDGGVVAERRAVLSHTSAGALWGLRPGDRMPAPVEVTVSEKTSVRAPGVRWHRSRTLLARDLRVRHHLPVTSPARTLVDLAGTLRPRELELALDEALRNRLTTRAQVAEVIARAGNRAGVKTLEALLAYGRNVTVTRSAAEERFLGLARSADLPEPEVNPWLQGLMVDFLWRRERIVVEIDGYAFHASRRRFEDDRLRGARLAAAGYQVIRITWLQMLHEPYAVIARLAQALAWGEAGPGRGEAGPGRGGAGRGDVENGDSSPASRYRTSR